MGMRGLRWLFGVCGAGLFVAVAAQIALAASDSAPSSSAPGKTDTSSTAHKSAARHRHTAKPTPHQAANHKEHKKEVASRPAAGNPAAPADKSLDQRPLLGPFSLGVETDPKVKRRSIRGGEYDPERDGDQSRGLQPSYLGFSLKAPFSW
jgi:hypothetical protein